MRMPMKRPRSAMSLRLALVAVPVAHGFSSIHAGGTQASFGKSFVHIDSLFKTCQNNNFSTKRRMKTDGWQAGDVYRDLDLLEQGIRDANAETNLAEVERKYLLDHMAKMRRPLFADFFKYAAAPLVIALILRITTLPVSIAAMLKRISNFHFWIFVVVAPLILNVFKRFRKVGFQSMPEELQNVTLDVSSLAVAIEWEPPEKSCRDAPLVLLEYWSSAVLPISILAFLNTILARTCLGETVSKATSFWMIVGKWLTRMAAVAAIHQNPEQLYEVNRPTTPRPITFSLSLLRSLISSVMWTLPIGLTIELYSLLNVFPTEVVNALYTSLFVMGVGTWFRMQEQESNDSSAVTQLKRQKRRTQFLYAITASAVWRRPLLSWVRRHGLLLSNVQQNMKLPLNEVMAFCQQNAIRTFTALVVGSLVIVIPILHIKSLLKLVRVLRTHDASLALDPAKFQEALLDENRRIWRYRLEWQDQPQRISQVIKKWKSNVVYWWFFKGRPQDILIQEYEQQLQERATSDSRILSDRLLRDAKQGETTPPRDLLKPIAMRNLATKHDEDYERNEFEDPLGIALYKTLGIGLGFQFDHDKPLAAGEQPSLRRLQARAAKSAIRHVQTLYDAQSAKEELEKITDTEKRNLKAKELRRQRQEEVNILADRMTALVPPAHSSAKDFDGRTQVKQFRQREPSRYIRVNSHEYRGIYDDDDDDDGDNNGSMSSMEAVKAVEDDIHNFNNVANSENDGGQNGGTSKDEDEFLDAYIEQEKVRHANHKDEEDDDYDDNDQIVLA